MLVNAVKDVAMALGDLIHATKAASGKAIHDPAMTALKESAKVWGHTVEGRGFGRQGGEVRGMRTLVTLTEVFDKRSHR